MTKRYPHPIFQYIADQILKSHEEGMSRKELDDHLRFIDAQIARVQEVLELNSPLIRLFKEDRAKLVAVVLE